MSLHIDNLIIEVTRRCNLKCRHCLRGNAQNRDMNIEAVRHFLQFVDSITDLTFGGGEPSLASYEIFRLREMVIDQNISISRFYCVTNAHSITNGFVMELLQWYLLSEEAEFEDGIKMVNWSDDKFHQEVSKQKGIKKLKALSFASPKYGPEYRYLESNIIPEGRGEAFNGTKKQVYPFEIEIDGDDIRIMEENLYLNCNGKLIAGCDWSYKSQNQKWNIIANVFDIRSVQDLVKAIEDWNERSKK